MNKIETSDEKNAFWIEATCNQHGSERCCYVADVFPTGSIQYAAESKAELVDLLVEDGWEIDADDAMELSDLKLGQELYLTCPACNPHFDDPVFWDTDKGEN
ncbi:MAG: hypothetical protein P8N94_02500 [Gammaproteobacteria bacterium]|nr:hypothetical protein [Gammaproteobacteria bacterium]